MKVSIEILAHFSCDCDRWFSIGDPHLGMPKLDVHCPYCTAHVAEYNDIVQEIRETLEGAGL